ncbi:hypothetical protein QTP70_008540 [Hemibagrus guttatus]|uniref:EF-hand domain-containing protein n=1 Tax=Hemibagrus guttatus TaxID=175788 RepID=A0AAE0Q4E4_9TELE|nr:hypothetical protein QTP70_008540 [Hemibagrus guttatus]
MRNFRVVFSTITGLEAWIHLDMVDIMNIGLVAHFSKITFRITQAGFPGGFPGQQQDPLFGYFTAIAGQDGHISAEELQTCLTQANFSGGYKPFNLETCRLMIGMLDRDMSGTMGFPEFKELWAVINGWKQHFMSIDKDMSGTVDPQEMQQAVSSMGYRLSPQAMNCIIKRYSTQGRITFDDYVACCVKLRALTGTLDNFYILTAFLSSFIYHRSTVF